MHEVEVSWFVVLNPVGILGIEEDMANTTLVNVDEQTAPKLVQFISSLLEENDNGGGLGQTMLDKGE